MVIRGTQRLPSRNLSQRNKPTQTFKQKDFGHILYHWVDLLNVNTERC